MQQVLLRDQTGLFYAGTDQRTANTLDAADFRDISIAAQLAFDQCLAGAVVVLNYLTPPCQIALPVREEWYPCSRPAAGALLAAPEDRLAPHEEALDVAISGSGLKTSIPVMAERMVILLVEDLADDVLLVQRAFAEAQIDPPLRVVRDGEEALDYLLGVGKYADREKYPLPQLVLLDLKLPKMDGIEVLRWIRLHPQLKALRVVVLTSSEDIFDVNRAYEAGANSFLVKPLEFTNYPAMMRTLSKFWLSDSKAPVIERTAGPPLTGGASKEAAAG